MSRQPSPGPSHVPIMSMPNPYHSQSALTHPTFIHKQKQKAIVGGITAGVEDVKYQAKYKELKKKVREIESDNDRLYFKLLLAKKNIRRMNLERAILYERLAAVPPTPGRHVEELPPDEDPMFARQQPPAPPEHAPVIHPNDRALVDYMRTHPNARIIQGPDGRVIAVEDTPSIVGPGGAAVQGSPPHGIPLVQGFRHDSAPGYDPNRQLPPLPAMVPMLQMDAPPELPPINDHYPPSYAHPQTRPHGHSHSSSSHQSRASSARPDLDAMAQGNMRLEGLPPPTHIVHSRSPSMPEERHGEPRSRRHDLHELTHQQHAYLQPGDQPLSPPSGRSPAYARAPPQRMHAHQRIGPGTNINRGNDPYERDLYERTTGHEHDERAEARGRWAREEHALAGPGVARGGSRSRSPRGWAEPVSKAQYEEEEEEHSGAPGPSAEIEARRASREEMEVDEHTLRGEIRSPGEGSAAGGSLMDNRGAKRMHADNGGGKHGNGGDVPDERMDEDD